jgi:hypothetical protein
MRSRLLTWTITVTLGLALAAACAQAAPAGRKAGISKSSTRLTPSERAGIPPEAFGSPVLSPDSSQVAWIADEGEGPNLFVGNAARTTRRQVTRYKFTPADDVMPGVPLLWSPDGRHVAYFEYSHAAARPATSSRAVVVAADGAGDPVRVSQPGRDLNTRPSRWLSESELKFKGLREASLSGGEENFVFDLKDSLARTEADYLAARALLKARADSAARAAAAPPAGTKK